MGLALVNFGLDEMLNPRLRIYKSRGVYKPRKEGTRWARVPVGQKRTPFCALHACPNGAGSAAAKPGTARSPPPIANVLSNIPVKLRTLTPTPSHA